ncbi:hypothetical protein FRC03_002641 [Tulasnella sp. 419]|nr:hypothetical protein FRC03_002641 [Tulasnella sp. 419]
MLSAGFLPIPVTPSGQKRNPAVANSRPVSMVLASPLGCLGSRPLAGVPLNDHALQSMPIRSPPLNTTTASAVAVMALDSIAFYGSI